jgi:hypothetical protein
VQDSTGAVTPALLERCPKLDLGAPVDAILRVGVFGEGNHEFDI